MGGRAVGRQAREGTFGTPETAFFRFFSKRYAGRCCTIR